MHALSKEFGRPIQIAVTVDPSPVSPPEQPSGPPSSPLSVMDPLAGQPQDDLLPRAPQPQQAELSLHQPQPPQYAYPDSYQDSGYQPYRSAQGYGEQQAQQPAAAQPESRDIDQYPPQLPREPQPQPAHQHDQPPPRPASARLNAKYTFETFVIGSSNRFAHAAAAA